MFTFFFNSENVFKTSIISDAFFYSLSINLFELKPEIGGYLLGDLSLIGQYFSPVLPHHNKVDLVHDLFTQIYSLIENLNFAYYLVQSISGLSSTATV